VLTRTFSDLLEEMDQAGTHIVFLWDEIPFLLDNVAKRQSSATAMEILDALGSLSQDYPRIRMVLTGSVGLHHILASLRVEGYLNSPINHMERVTPGPLAPDDATQLTLGLLRGTQLVTPESVEATLKRELADSDNDWDLAHYRTRLPLYYAKDEALVLLVLDAVAASGGPLSFELLCRQLSSQTVQAEPERLRNVLKLLQQDHYLERGLSGDYRFRFPLIRRWWRFDRSL
jgi:hypothetical protein